MHILKRVTATGVAILILSLLAIASSYFLQVLKQPPATASLVPRNGVFDTSSDLVTPFGSAVLERRDDHSCAAGRPCANGACCGPNGFCGYGSDYCGNECLSNCNATAECGQYAYPAGKTCPLKTCCSQYGFCGTTETFCIADCQSDCLPNPQPAADSPKGRVLSRVIGYYQAWTAETPCHAVLPKDLPLNELTHLNHAFASVDPDTFELTTGDPTKSGDVFYATTGTKAYNPSLKVFIAVGGWAFSDNGTKTQATFGKIASTSENRQKFAENVLEFLHEYDFDGIDIDWEYPGAPDRGGKPEDTANFVSLLQTMRAVLDTSSNYLGLTFTAPASYWYLRWFDLPNLVRYADWVNFMSYDLHGVWDRNNPIGNIVQSHTNLTEISSAAQLLWRVGVKPEKISLGLGFYGRSFELSNPACTVPGCLFRGGGASGPCTHTSGVLAYYEIKSILNQVPGLQPVYDKEAAAKYLVFDKVQWVSYDDADTFQQKLDWANNIGIGGIMIWAADMDDDRYSAISSLVGTAAAHVDTDTPLMFAPVSQNIAPTWYGQNGQNCEVSEECVDRYTQTVCPSGYNKVGYDVDDCKDNNAKAICCPDVSPTGCLWRGNPAMCDGYCHVGEVLLFHSSKGGEPSEDRHDPTKKCGSGSKVFCCAATAWQRLTKGCRWTACGGKCKDPEKSLIDSWDGCISENSKKQYCCPKDAPLQNCFWYGREDLYYDNMCPKNQVTLDIARYGYDVYECGVLTGFRKKSACCEALTPDPPKLNCQKTTCEMDPHNCYGAGDETPDTSQDGLAKRGKARKGDWQTTGKVLVEQASWRYPTTTQYMGRLAQPFRDLLELYFDVDSSICGQPTISVSPLQKGSNSPAKMHVEHVFGNGAIKLFCVAANSGRLVVAPAVRDSKRPPIYEIPSVAPRIGDDFWEDDWTRSDALPAGEPLVVDRGDKRATSKDLRNSSKRVYEAVGSMINDRNLILCRDTINLVKGSLEDLKRPMSNDRFETFVQASVDGGDTITDNGVSSYWSEQAAYEAWMAPIRDDTVRLVREQLQLIEKNLKKADGLVAFWDEWHDHHFGQASELARLFVSRSVKYAEDQYQASTNLNKGKVSNELSDLNDKVIDLWYCWEKTC